MNQSTKPPNAEPPNFTVPLSFEAHAAARNLQNSLPLTQHNYLKALAVYAVDYYLRCLGIATEPHQSDWAEPWIAKLIDVADLWVKPYGKLECCYVLPDATTLHISPDAWGDRIGYLAVQFSPTLKSVTLLGFTPVPVTELPLSELRSLDQFLDHLADLDQTALISNTDKVQTVGAAMESVMNPDRQTTHPVVNLRNWLEGAVETGWQIIAAQDGRQRVAVRGSDQFEITVRQAKLLDVGMDLGEHSVVLSLAITLNADTSMNVLVQTYPAPGQRHLPPNLKLTMLSETVVLQEVCSREQDSYVQLRHFRGEAGDSFDIQVSLDQVNILESFVL
jgi:Protein of unknown function (DUF1822)